MCARQVFKKFIRDFVTCSKCKSIQVSKGNLQHVARYAGTVATWCSSHAASRRQPHVLDYLCLQTKLSIDKKGKVQMKCSACGAKAPVRLSKLCASQFHKSTSVCGVQVDQSHKVVKEILKYPPGSEKKDGKKEKKGNPNGKKARRQALKESSPLDDVDGEEAGDEAAAPEPEPQGARPEEDEEAKAARRKKEKEEKKLRKAEKAAKRAAKEGRIERKASTWVSAAKLRARLC
eukprot:COSAG01_NODE_13189_length_1622_cov_9.119501_2_plen_233_part_00